MDDVSGRPNSSGMGVVLVSEVLWELVCGILQGMFMEETRLRHTCSDGFGTAMAVPPAAGGRVSSGAAERRARGAKLILRRGFSITEPDKD